MGQSIQQGLTVSASGGGFTEVTGSPAQPTSDVASVIFTGLSAYKLVLVVYAVQLVTSGAYLQFDARVSAGTWRTGLVRTAGTAAGNVAVAGMAIIAGFNQSNDMKVIAHQSGSSGSAIDASDAANVQSVASSNASAAGVPSWNEVWDELRLIPSSGNIEGSTADNRGMIYVYGQV